VARAIEAEHGEPFVRPRPARRVLVVDDHAGFRRCATALLTAAGFDVVGEADTGSAALERAAELRPELVVLDVQLPDFDGFEVSSRLLARDAALKIVLVSSRDRSAYGPLIETSGAIGFIAKSELSAGTLATVLA
jgi:DNA-binding NarL/FixJ family response regulator